MYMLCVVKHSHTVNNQALVIVGPDLDVMNALPMLLSYLRY
jgi:hypothetical protein